MQVLVVELRATGMRLTAEELAAACVHRGELTISAGSAYLHSGDNPHLWQLVLPLHQARVTKLVRQ